MTASLNEFLPLECLYARTRSQPDAVYLTQPIGGGQYRDFTWAEVSDEVRRMAAHLQSYGWEPGSKIGILSKNTAWWLMAEYAIWMAGYVSVPIYPSLTSGSVRFTLEHSEAKALFLGQLDSKDVSAMTAGIPSGLIVICPPLGNTAKLFLEAKAWDEIIASTPPIPGFPSRPLNDVATIIYTSGTTGAPKGVMHAFSSLAQAARLMLQNYGFNRDDRLLSYLSLSHVADRISSQMSSLGAGLRLYFSESLDTFPADLRHARPTVFMSVPRLWGKFRQAINAKIPQEQLAAMLEHPQQGPAIKKKILTELGLDNVRLAISGAAPIPPDLHKWYLDLGLGLLEVYGMTENMGLSHANLPGKGKVGCVGQPVDGVDIRLTETGEAEVHSPGMMLGYFKDPERTTEVVTSDGYLRTGDVGEIDDEGYFRITGRAKDTFKTSKGKYVAPAPIESILSADPNVEACCVTGVGCPQPYALITLSLSTLAAASESGDTQRYISNTIESLRDAVNERLDPHERLDFVVILPDQWTVENGFVTPTFKVKRAVLEQHYCNHYQSWVQQQQKVIWA